MATNKRIPTKVDGTNCSESNDYVLNSDTLDQLYKEQLTELRDLIFKQAQPEDIEICRKWLKVFGRASNADKMARNCLCTLMQEQIKESNCLQEPFTNLENCNRDLECLLRELDDQQSVTLNSRSFANSEQTFKSHCFVPGYVNEIAFGNQQQQQTLSSHRNESQNIKLTNENNDLERKIKYLHLQVNEKQFENIKLKEIAEKCRLEKEMFEDQVDNMKKSLLDSIRVKLLEMEECGIKNQFQFFQQIFAQFSSDKEFMDIMRKYDLEMQYILQNHFKCEFDKRKEIIASNIYRKFDKNRIKLRQKYEKHLKMINETHKLQLKLAKLNCFSVLRQIFINHYNESGRIEGWEILKMIEDKYQIIVNSDLKEL